MKSVGLSTKSNYIFYYVLMGDFADGMLKNETVEIIKLRVRRIMTRKEYNEQVSKALKYYEKANIVLTD